MLFMRVLVMSCVLGLLSVGNAFAHHSFAAYDMQKEIRFSGTVVEVQYTNPHAWVFIDVTDENGKTVTWAVQSGGPNILMRMGWKRNTIKAGDKIEAVIHPMHDTSKKGGSLVMFILEDGTEIRG